MHIKKALLRLAALGLTAGVSVLAPAAVLAMEAEGASAEHANVDVANIPSLQRGARNFVNYCMGCHSAKFVRYNRLARDLGSRLGCGGYLTSLRRTAVGVFREEQALPVDGDEHLFASSLRPLADAVANLPRIVLDADAIRRLGHGQCIDCVDTPTNSESTTSDVAIFDDAGVLRAMARRECHAQSSWWRPVKVYG